MRWTGLTLALAWACSGQVVEPATEQRELVPLPVEAGGRVLMEKDLSNQTFGSQAYRYQWPATSFETHFKGSEVYFRILAGRQILHVLVDTRPVASLVAAAPGVYRISRLGPGAHSIRLEVVTESQTVANVFGGFAAPADSGRSIEFIGDSYTVGYGNTSTSRNCTREEVWSTTDTSQSFPAVVARHYGAEYQVNAISGRGVVRNYDGFAADPLPIAYNYALLDHSALYNNPSWRPQVVVVALGTNDFSTPLHPREKWADREALHQDFEKTYVEFVRSIRAKYPAAFIVLWATDGLQGEIHSEVEKVVQALQRAGETRLTFVPMNGLQMNGCDSHPSVADDQVIAGKLIDAIDSQGHVWDRP